MTKANLVLPNGTKVEIEGSAEEVHKLLSLYGKEGNVNSKTSITQQKKKTKKVSEKTSKKDADSESDIIADIVNQTKECDEAESIEENILDRTSVVDKTLLPLYIVHEHFDNSIGLQSGDIAKITSQLGIPIAQPNASRTLSKTASRYVMGDKVRKARQPVKYKLNRRGINYLKAVISGESDG